MYKFSLRHLLLGTSLAIASLLTPPHAFAAQEDLTSQNQLSAAAAADDLEAPQPPARGRSNAGVLPIFNFPKHGGLYALLGRESHHWLPTYYYSSFGGEPKPYTPELPFQTAMREANEETGHTLNFTEDEVRAAHYIETKNLHDDTVDYNEFIVVREGDVYETPTGLEDYIKTHLNKEEKDLEKSDWKAVPLEALLRIVKLPTKDERDAGYKELHLEYPLFWPFVRNLSSDHGQRYLGRLVERYKS